MKKAEVKKGKKKNVLKEYWPLYLMMLPALLYLLINNYIPMAGMVIAFKKLNFAKGIWASPWAGLKNFKFLFASKDAWIITRNTLLYNVAFILVNMVVGIAIAILITEVRNTKLKKIYQSAILLPFLMSMVILSYIVYALLSAENGLVNNSILPLFHIDPIQWYQKPKYWPAILIIANCWKGVGYGCLIYIASLIGIDPSFYEAARLDGASKWQKLVNIDIPMLLPTATIMFILRTGSIMSVGFEKVYLLQNTLNSSASEIISTYVYKMGLVSSQYSLSAAIGLFNNIINLVLLLSVNYISKKMSDTSLV